MACNINLHRLLYRNRRLLPSISSEFPFDRYAEAVVSSQSIPFLFPIFSGKRWLSNNVELAGMTAYDILGVSQTSSLGEIKASFRKLAKETHPDLAHSQNHSSYASKKFVQVLAAYEILSDSTKRAHYDHHIMSWWVLPKQQPIKDAPIFKYNFQQHPTEKMEVVEWLKWYRHEINDIVNKRRVTSGSGYFDTLERDFYSAMCAAYYGPEIESVDLLPDRFEAEVRSLHSTPEVLHLVSGRDLFGIVCLSDKKSRLSRGRTEKIAFSTLDSVSVADNVSIPFKCNNNEDTRHRNQSSCADFLSSDAYRDLELHLWGRVIAVAKRTPPESVDVSEDEDSQDHIHVYLASHANQLCADSSVESKFLLGVIKGLGTTSEEGTCYVYNDTCVKTHMIMKHRTLLVKHLHWFLVGEKFSSCECRCTRARLPPSKFWLFEPRSAMHDIGGWYIETFGRDSKGKPVPQRRYWDGFDTNTHNEEKLHPAVYVFALAYRTLDIEDARRGKRTIKDKVGAKISRVLSWCKKLLTLRSTGF